MLEILSWAKLTASYALKIIKFFVPFVPKLWNIFRRPKLEITIRQGNIAFKTTDGKEQWHPYVFLQISNRSNCKLQIQPGFVRINNESYQVQVQSDINFAKMNPGSQNRWTFCDNEIYNVFHNNWLAISEKRFSFSFEPHHELFFPIKPTLNVVHQLVQKKKNSLLFFPNEKISLTLRINGKDREYGITKRNPAYELFLNYLAAELNRAGVK